MRKSLHFDFDCAILRGVSDIIANLKANGSIAQLGERQLDKLDAAGSSPAVPIIIPEVPLQRGAFLFVNQLPDGRRYL